MDAPPAITLPPDCRPTDGRFGSGPSKVRTEALATLAAQGTSVMGTSHRQPPVRSLVGRVRTAVADLLELPDGYEVLLGLGGSTAFWDAAAASLLVDRPRHLVLGEFSAKFAKVVAGAPHLGEPDIVETDPGVTPNIVDHTGDDAYCYPHNETSTGVTVPVHRPAAGTGLVVVDATSAAGGIHFDPADTDVYYFAPQKCLGSDAGLWLACCSPAAIERIERRARDRDHWVPATLDLAVALENSRQDQTYNTPALATLWLLRDQLEWMLDHGGLRWAAARCARSAATVYAWADAHERATPFVADPAVRSPVTATVDFDGSVDAAAVARALRSAGIVDVEPYRKLGRNQLRIATFPAVEPDDVAALTRAVDHVIGALVAADR